MMKFVATGMENTPILPITRSFHMQKNLLVANETNVFVLVVFLLLLLLLLLLFLLKGTNESNSLTTSDSADVTGVFIKLKLYRFLEAF